MPGSGAVASGGTARGQAGWSPTVANIIVLIIVEIFAFAMIRYFFTKVL